MKSRKKAIAYYRTSSATNVGADKDSQRRQREAVASYAKANRLEIVESFYDAAISGADPIDTRPGFVELLDRCKTNGFTVILVENAGRFARDLAVQLTGHRLLQTLGIELIPVDAPTYFTDPSPTAELVRQILGAVAQFEKTSLVIKLRGARQRKKTKTGRCEGRKPVPDDVVQMAKELASDRKRRSLRAISAALQAAGHTVLDKEGKPTDRPYQAQSVKLMLARKPPKAQAA
jgi:DNA invertase Pin-like site-specific DNA recombinase